MMNEQHREYHHAASIFPLMQDDEFEALKADLAKHGMREAIVVTLDGKILDGRNRHRACLALGIEPRFETYTGDSPLAYVVSLNLRRKHLNGGQKRSIEPLIEQALAEETVEERRTMGPSPARAAARAAAMAWARE